MQVLKLEVFYKFQLFKKEIYLTIPKIQKDDSKSNSMPEKYHVQTRNMIMNKHK